MSDEKATPDLSGILEKVMSNPAALNMLAGLLGNREPAKESPPPPAPQEREEASPVLALPQRVPHREKDQRICFLEAMRPFLSPQRQATVDRMVKMSEMVTMFYSVMRR